MGNYLSAMFSSSDSASSSRVGKMLATVVVLVCWSWVSTTTHTIADIPNGVLAMLGVIWGAGLGQKAIESKTAVQKAPDAPRIGE